MFGALSFSGHVGENLLGYAYDSELLPKGHWGICRWINHRAGKVNGTYRATDYFTEFEYGVTDRLHASLCLTAGTDIAREHGEPGKEPPSNYYAGNEHLRSLSILVHDAVGLAFPLILGWHIVRGRRGGLTPSRPGR